MRGRCYAANGQTDKAQTDYLYIETHTKKPDILMFVKASLGKKEEAIALADSLLKADTTENRYNVACVYALLGENELALLELEKEMKDGLVNFTHLRLDPDLQSLSGNELELLIQKYKAFAKERIEKFQKVEQKKQCKEKVVEIPFSTSNGVTKVDCTINGLPLNFIFVIIPVVGFFFCALDKQSNMKNLVSIFCCLFGVLSIMMIVTVNFLSLGSLISLLLYLLISFLSALSIFARMVKPAEEEKK